MSDKKSKNTNGRVTEFSAPTLKLAVKQLMAAESSGKLDGLDSFVTITVRDGDISPEYKEHRSNQPV